MKRIVKPKMPLVEEKPETGILFVQGVEKDLIEFVRHETKRLGYSWTHEYLNKLFREVKNQSEGTDAAGSKVRKSAG